MSAIGRILKLGLVPVCALGLGACGLGNNEEVTTQSVAPPPAKQQQVARVEPDCATLKAEIDKLNGQQIPAKFQQAAAKKYTPTQEEWGLFPRYNNLVDTYAVKKCQPALPVQAEKKKPAPTKATTAQKPPQKTSTATPPAEAQKTAALKSKPQTPEQKAPDSKVPGVTISVPPAQTKPATN